MGRLKSRFVRALVETLQQETSGTALPRLRHGLPPHWLRVLSREVFASTDQDATLDLETGLDLLLAMERLLSAGTGKVMIAVASSLASRVLYGSPGLVVPGDTSSTLRHLRAPFELPFLGTDVHFAVSGSEPAYALELALSGLPTATRWLAWTGLGYVQAASSFSGHDPAHFRFEPQLSGELVRINARRIHTGVVQFSSSSAGSRGAAIPRGSAGSPRSAISRSSALSTGSSVRPVLRSVPVRRRTPPTNAAARVEQILSRAQSARTAENVSELAASALPAPPPRSASSTPPSSTARPSSNAPAQSGTRPALGSALQPPRKSAL